MTLPRLYGRDDELGRIDRLLAETRTGGGQALMLRGEAGIGKSALLAHAAGSADGLLVLHGAGAEAEADLPFAGLHLLLRPVSARIDTLEHTHAATLQRVLAGDGTGDRFAVGVALLELLSTLAAEVPLLVLVDDLQWLDAASADAVLFAARRLAGEPIAVLAAVRERHAPISAGIPEHRLSGVDESAARRILETTDLPAHRRDQIVADAGGNPLALLALGTCAPVDVEPYATAIAGLPTSTRTVLLVAAADHTCDTGTILAAARTLGADVDDLRVAEEAGLVMFTDTCFGFSHPLVGPAVYRNAAFAQRLQAHRALVEVLTEAVDVDRRARHLAAATTTPDESVASALEQGVAHARMRGGMAAVADAYECAARLSPAPRDEGLRLTSAARAAADAGQPDRARDLAEQAAALLPDPADAAWSAAVRAVLAEDDGRAVDAHHTLVATARRIAADAPCHAGRLLFAAAESAWRGGDVDKTTAAAEAAETLGLPTAHRVRAVARSAHADPAGQVAALRALLDDADGSDHTGSDDADGSHHADGAPCVDAELGLRARTSRVSWWTLLGDHDTAEAEALDLLAEARARAATGVLPVVLTRLARAQLYLGDLDGAVAAAEEAHATATGIGQRRGVAEASGVLATVAALRGDEERARSHAAGADPAAAAHASTLADLAAGRFDAAVDRLVRGPATGVGGLSVAGDLVEAAARATATGDESPAGGSASRDAVAPALAELTTRAEASGTRWARAVAARGRAVHDDPGEFASAVTLAGQAGPFEQARTELAYGEWLRRDRCRVQARGHLRAALTTFDRLGALPWAERARNELRAAGANGDGGPVDPDTATLTPQELRIVRLAADGLSNRDIGSRLYLSPRTVGYHLYKAYPKLGVAGRGELAKLELMA